MSSRLSNEVTLCTIETHYHDLGGRALEECVKRLPFQKVVTFSDRDILPGAKNIPTTVIPNITDYCDFMLKSMWPFFDTDYTIFAQWDAMVFDPTKWTDDYLNYDYIGAVWPWEPEGQNVGCGGFSLRSRRLLNALRDPRIHMTENSRFGMKHEDAYICVEHRAMLEQEYGIKFAPSGIAAKFAYELGAYQGSMAFHGFWNIINFMPADTTDYFFVNRPKGMFSEMHRSHHNIVALGVKNRMDLFDSAIDEILAASDFPNLVQWLSNEQFPNRDHILLKLTS